MGSFTCRRRHKVNRDFEALPPSCPPKEAPPTEEQQLTQSTGIPATQTPRETSCAQYTVSPTNTNTLIKPHIHSSTVILNYFINI